MIFKSACFKLTIFYVAIVMLISIIFSVVLYKVSYKEINSGLNRQQRVFENMPFPGSQSPSMPNFENLREEQLTETIRSLKINLFYVNMIILLIASGLSYWLAKRTLKPIEEMMEAQNRFTADASHELRTPLTAMKTEIEVNLRDKKFSLQNAKNLLKSNLEEINKLEKLSSVLLKLAQYEKKQDIKFKKVSLEDILVEAYSRVEKLAKDKKIKFDNKLKNIKIYGDKDSLIELFVTILENSIKYSHKNSKIYISMDEKNNKAHIFIKDEGIGIKASDMPYIFNRFYRADPSRSKIKTDGYGLGLSIAQQVLKLHKGSIKVDSFPGKGSTFSIALPV